MAQTENKAHDALFFRWRVAVTSITACLNTTVMLVSSSARTMPSDLDYFNKSKPNGMVASTSTDIYVTTRRAWKEQQAAEFASTLTLSSFTDSAASTPSSSDSLLPVTKKRKEPDHPTLSPPKAKKSRSPPVINVTKPQSTPKSKKRATSSIPSSRQSSRPRTVASSPEPEHSASRSRSVSAFPPVETPILRPCCIEEDGTPGPGFISNEDVVRKLIENDKNYYKGCMCIPARPSGGDIDLHLMQSSGI
jgi:H3 lysine-79-specific histone-lysine N-methyltransferase